MQPNSRFNIWVDEEEMTPGNKPFKTGNTDVSVRIRSLNGVPLIVERAMWWPGASNTWYEAHNSPGSTRTASRWVLAEGENGGAIGWNTYILVANTGTTAGTISVRLLLPNGQTGGVLTGLPIRGAVADDVRPASAARGGRAAGRHAGGCADRIGRRPACRWSSSVPCTAT